MPVPNSRDLIRSLQSDTYPICGGMKRSAQTMFPKDYRKLPAILKRDLYNRIGEGYEQAVQKAMASLGVEEFIVPSA